MGKRIAAIIGIVALVLMYVVSMVAALCARPEAHGLFMASMGATVFIPVVLWIYVRLYELAHRNDAEHLSMKEMRRLNKRLKSGESPEKLAEEIEEKYKKKP